MSETPAGSVTVDTSLLDSAVPPASEQDTESQTAPSVPEEGDGRTTAPAPSVEELQKELDREKASRQKAEKAYRDQERSRRQMESENQKMRGTVMQNVEDQLKAINDRLDQGEQITMAELQRRDRLVEQRLELRLNQRDNQEHQFRRRDAAEQLEKAALDAGMSDQEYAAFLGRHSSPTFDPITGQTIMAPFGNYTDPEEALKVGVALLYYETRDRYENKVRETATEKADVLAREKLRRAQPGASSVKPTQPANPQDAYKAAIMSVGVKSNPDSWL